jgi:hypothetical protein
MMASAKAIDMNCKFWKTPHAPPLFKGEGGSVVPVRIFSLLATTTVIHGRRGDISCLKLNEMPE